MCDSGEKGLFVMPGTFVRLFVQIILAVKDGCEMGSEDVRNGLHSHLKSVLSKRKHTPIALNSGPEHVHVLLMLKPTESLSDLVRELKASSARYMRNRAGGSKKFQWQQGYAAFSYSRSMLEQVKSYIREHEVHHRSRDFRQEYYAFLQKYEVEFRKDLFYVEQTL